MPNPLVYKGGGLLQVMTTAERNALANVVLADMVTTPGTGSMTFVSGGSNVLIGTFTDTRFDSDIGGANVTILSTTTSIYQDLSTPSGTDAPRPIVYNSGTSPLQNMTDGDLNTLADQILSYGVNNEGPGSYQLQSSVPSPGTWSSIGSITDTYSGVTTTVKNLYQRIDTSFSSERPLKSGGQGILQQFTTAEIQYLSKRVRQRILDTGVGKYLFQAATPSPGTWVSKGSISDTRPTDTPTNYTADYTGTEFYTGSTLAYYTADYTGTYTGEFTGSGYWSGEVNYTGNFAGFTTFNTTYYTGPVAWESAFSGTYNAPATYNRPATWESAFSGTYNAPATYNRPVTYFTSYVGDFTGAGPSYVSDATYVGTGFFAGTTTYVGSANWTGPSFAGYFTGPSFAGVYVSAGTNYQGQGPIWINPYQPAGWTGLENYYIGTVFWSASNSFTGPSFAGSFTGPSFAGTWSGPTYFSGPANFSGPQNFGGAGPTYVADAFFAGTYNAPAPSFQSFGGFAGFTGFYTGTFSGFQGFGGFVGWSGTYTGTFNNEIPYTGPATAYTAPASFTGYYTGTVAYTGPQTFQNFFEGAVFNLAYTAGAETAYTADVNYQTDYLGSTVTEPSNTITTITLWRRIA